jgi:phospholipid/cholesterol/gamma-HCH transport system substrate-binding protein
MSAYRRNILVGATVLGALIALGWMILQFGGEPAKMFTTPGNVIHFMGERADGLSDGSVITYRGVNVGRITAVRRTDDGKQVVIDGEVDRKPPLPANVEGVIRATGLIGGGSVLVLTLTDTEPKGELAAGAMLVSRFVGLDLLPPEFATLAAELRMTSEQFRQSRIVTHLDEQVQKAGKVMDSVQSLVDDPKMRENLKQSMENIRIATATADKIAAKIDKLSDQSTGVMQSVNERTLEIAKVLQNVQSITNKIDKGEGTAGQLINDPKLYQGLVDSTRELNTTIATLNRLVEQWEQEGLHFKLSK